MQNLGSRDFGDSLASHLSRENRVFCKNRIKTQIVFQKLFSFPRITCPSLCLLFLSLSQNCHFHSKNLYFSFQSSLQIQEKVWVFTPFYFISSLKHFFFMDLLFVLKYWNMVEEHGFLLFVMKLMYGFCWEWWYNACFTCFYYMLIHYTMSCVAVCIPSCW